MLGTTRVSNIRLPLRVVLGWASGSLAMSIMYQATSVLLLRYLVDFLGVAASLAGAMLGGSKLFDAFIDPLIGVVSDRTKSRWGRRRPYLLGGGLLCAATFLFIFTMPLFGSMRVRLAVIEATLVMLAAGYGIFNIPYMAMPAEMAIDGPERTRLISFRVAAVAMGGIASMFFGPIIVDTFGGGRQGHRMMAVIVATIILVSATGCFWFTKDAPMRAVDPAPGGRGFREQFRLAVQNRPFFLLMLIKLLTSFGSGMQGAAQPFFFLLILKSSYSVMGTTFLVQACVMIVSQPLWVSALRVMGSKRLYAIITPIWALGALSWLIAVPHEPVALIMLRAFVTGIINGGILLTQQAMLPETIEYDFRTTGLRREGVFSGLYTTMEKVSAAFSASAVGLVLAAFGYVASTGGGAVQPEGVLTALKLCYAASAVCALLSGFTMRGYRLEV